MINTKSADSTSNRSKEHFIGTVSIYVDKLYVVCVTDSLADDSLCLKLRHFRWDSRKLPTTSPRLPTTL